MIQCDSHRHYLDIDSTQSILNNPNGPQSNALKYKFMTWIWSLFCLQMSPHMLTAGRYYYVKQTCSGSVRYNVVQTWCPLVLEVSAASCRPSSHDNSSFYHHYYHHNNIFIIVNNIVVIIIIIIIITIITILFTIIVIII